MFSACTMYNVHVLPLFSLCWPTTLIWWKLFLMTPLALHCGCNDGRTRHHWQLRLLNWATRSSRAMAARWQLCFCIVFHWGRAAQSHYLPPLLLIDSPHRHNLPSNKHYFIQTGFPAEKAFNTNLIRDKIGMNSIECQGHIEMLDWAPTQWFWRQCERLSSTHFPAWSYGVRGN